MNVFVFDIETVPDIAAGRKLQPLEGLEDKEVADALFALRRGEKGTDFLPLYMQKIVAISAVLRTRDNIKVWSLGTADSSEKELIERFFKGLDKYTPTLVSWNGSGFDLPVLHYRMLFNGVSAPRYWESGENDQSFRYNNYLSRYHYRHLDIMDVLAGYQMRANAPLDTISTLLGFPGKMGLSGASVWDQYQQGNIEGIRNYCDTDVLNTYLVYLRFELIRGKITEISYKKECETLKEMLIQAEQPHFTEFLSHWKNDPHV